MVKKLLIIVLLIFNIVLPITILKISNNQTYVEEKDYIGRIIINKIDINEKLYDINSPENTIEKHISILKESIYPDQDNSIMLIAAHSGIGKIAYFERLDELDINDEIIIIYKNKKYKYIVKDIYEEKKNGYININKEKNKQLVLTTCSPKKEKYQLIINCIIKESI